jgi:hypothetical protein
VPDLSVPGTLPRLPDRVVTFRHRLLAIPISVHLLLLPHIRQMKKHLLTLLRKVHLQRFHPVVLYRLFLQRSRIVLGQNQRMRHKMVLLYPINLD